MVQADASVNYYQALGVPPSADENEIRKAFRQLALKYHPDRNPGRESEFVVKFQQIQAAHEILSDSAQRAKYDQERRRYRSVNISTNNPNTPRSRPPPPPRNAYTTTTPSGSYYRAPPPRPPPQRPPPPQHNTTFTNGADRFTHKNFRAPPTAQRPRSGQTDAEARQNVFTAWQKMKAHRGEEQPRPPNANVNNPNGMPFGRSKSTRVPSTKKGFDPAIPGADEPQARSSYRANFDRPVPSPPHSGDPLKHFKEQMERDIPNVPYTESNRQRTPYSSAAGERTSMYGDGVGRSASVRSSPTHGRPGSSNDTGSFSDSGQKGTRNSYGGAAPKGSFPSMYPNSSDEESEDDVPRNRSGPSSQSQQKPQQPYSQPRAPFGQNPRDTPNATTPNTFKSRSEESINMKFSPSDWHGKFEGKADYFATPSIPKGTSGKGRSSPVRGRPQTRSTTERGPVSGGQSQPPPPVSPFSMPGATQMPPPPPPLGTQTTFPTGTASAPHSAKFTPEAWKETFKEPSWAFSPNAKETSPRRGAASTTKRPKANSRKPSTVPNGMKADIQTDGLRPKGQPFTENVARAEEPEAMDIDSTTPTPPTEKPQPLATEGDKTYKRDTPIKFSGSTRSTPSSPQDKRPRSSTMPMSNGSATAPTSTTEPHPPGGLNGLSGLKNVEPFLPSSNGDGLSGLGDLGASLPFKSSSSSSHPTKTSTTRQLKYPSVPGAPQAPISLTETAVTGYFLQMDRYISSFRKYNQTMVNHFAARDAELDNLDAGFIRNRGETTKGIGFTSYMKKMKEDQCVMETWKVAQEMHMLAMGQCEQVRNKTMRAYAER